MQLLPTEFEKLKEKLLQKGYTHYENQPWKSCDSIFWKSFHKTYDEFGEKIIPYQIGYAVYDFRKYPQYDFPKSISIQYEFLLGADQFKVDRLDLSISDSKMTIEEFEEFCENLYQSKIIQDLLISNSQLNS
jgi:hypothetical protein